MPGKFPGPYVNDTKQDDALMVYVNNGGFEHAGIGSRPSAMPKDVKNSNSIEHTGSGPGNAGRKGQSGRS